MDVKTPRMSTAAPTAALQAPFAPPTAAARAPVAGKTITLETDNARLDFPPAQYSRAAVPTVPSACSLKTAISHVPLTTPSVETDAVKRDMYAQRI